MSYPDPSGDPAPARGGAYTYSGPISWEYSPELDRDADPGEIVWTWVAFEENAHVGKDRPVAVVGRADDGRLVALMLSSKEHDGDRGWISIGTGPWDKEGRESWVRRDRVLAVHAEAVRREGAVMPRTTYEAIVVGMGGLLAARCSDRLRNPPRPGQLRRRADALASSRGCGGCSPAGSHVTEWSSQSHALAVVQCRNAAARLAAPRLQPLPDCQRGHDQADERVGPPPAQQSS